VSRAIGALVGSAVADALGAPFEFGGPGEYSERFPEPPPAGGSEMIGGGTFDWAPGEFTDDTQMAVHVAESLVDNDLALERDDLWSRWRAWSEDAADVGITTRRALGFDDWRDVVHPDPERTAANGALMRSTPFALLPTPREVVRSWVVHQAAMTHAHPDAGHGAWLAVAAIRAAIDGGDPFSVLHREVGSLPSGPHERFAAVLGEDWHPMGSHTENGSVWVCLATAVWSVRDAATYEESVVRAIDCGGDTDTVACVAGALAGAIHSIDAIPARWRNDLHGSPDGRRTLRADDLETLARRLAGYR